MNKCKYCGKVLKSNFEFCDDECENRYKETAEKDSGKIKFLAAGIILGFLIMFYGILSNRDFMIGIGIIVMGMDIVLLPFTTPETTAFLGYKKSKFAGKIAGVLVIAVGIWVGFN